MTPVGNKESRREKRREKHNLRNERMAARALDVWSRMGIKTSAAPKELKELLGKLPRIYFPTFELEGVEPGPQLDAFLDAVVDEVTEPTEEWGISTSEFFEICMPCAEYVGKHARAIPFDAFDAVDKVCRPFYEKWHSAMRFFLDESMRNLHVAAVDESRLNGIVWRLGLRGDWAPWFHLNVVVYSDIPEQRKFVVDGVPRPAWRVMTAGYSSEPKSIEWDTKALELE